MVLIYKIINKSFYLLYDFFSRLITHWRLAGNHVHYGKGFRSNGIPVISVHKKGVLTIGEQVTLNNGRYYNQIGRQQPCFLIVEAGAELVIGNNVGMSAVAIVCMEKITIADNVKIGGNTVIYDTDFHSADPEDRLKYDHDRSKVITRPVNIKKNAFIGAHSILLKGVTIGENSVIGAGSVVTKNIPDNEVWAGNPAVFIKKLNNT